MTQMTQINPEALNVASQMILKEIDLRGTDAERKAKLDQFEIDWKALTGKNDLTGARFVGIYIGNDNLDRTALFILRFSQDSSIATYEGISMNSADGYGTISKNMNEKVSVNDYNGSLTITPLFSHLEPVEIFTDNSAASKQKNIDNLNAYKSNLEELGVNTANGFQMLIKIGNDQYGMLANSDNLNNFKGYSSGFGKMYTLVLQSSSGAVISSQLQSIMSNDLVTTQKEIVPAINEGFTLAQAVKDLHTPIAISTENTTESKAQNVRNIADFVAKAKAAGIADVNGMAVTCLIDNDYSGVGYLYLYGDTTSLSGIETFDDSSEPMYFKLDPDGGYADETILMGNSQDRVTSSMLTQGTRRPIILTPSTTEVDEGTYQKLLSDDVDVMLIAADGNLCGLTYKTENDDNFGLMFSCFSVEGETDANIYIYGYDVSITKNSPHTCFISEQLSLDFANFLNNSGYITKNTITPVLQEIDLRDTDAERKAKLDQFEADWKALTGASDIIGARFVGYMDTPSGYLSTIFAWNSASGLYEGVGTDDVERIYKVQTDPGSGKIYCTPLFSHLEPIEIFDDNSIESKKKNIDNINTYKANLEQLRVDTSISFQIPIYRKSNSGVEESGFLIYSNLPHVYKPYSGLFLNVDETSFSIFGISSTGEFIEQTYYATLEDVQQANTLAQAVKAFSAIELKASNNAANKAALTAYKKILTNAGISITNGYSVPVRITGNTQEYHGMLNIGTGTLLSGIVTDANETHHYPFNVSTADGAITFDVNNYFLEKTSNEVTEMLDAIKYSYTPVPLTATTSTNKTQLDLFLSKVPNAQVMHCTYKDMYAGTLHKINESWYGVLVGESNTIAGQLSIKLQADGTIVEGTA